MSNCVFDKGKKCIALLTHNCEKCSFHKTGRELVEGREKARERLESLPKKQYDAIMKKYYSLRRGETEVEE